MKLEMPGQIVRESRRFLAMEQDRMTFELQYQFPDETLLSMSELRFPSRKEIEENLALSGLHIEKLLGDWDGNLFNDKESEEMIFVTSRKPIA